MEHLRSEATRRPHGLSDCQPHNLGDYHESAPSPELLIELHRRLAAYDADPSRALTWEQVVAKVTRTKRG
ncbi:addiction module protein [Zavarzinella formosa]|uniref:addiction module protein n=1 Tax=Zavarzinella formosa TaxID=360055 RepID=UPI0009079316